MKGQLSHTKVPERLMSQKYQEPGRIDEITGSKYVHGGFISYTFTLPIRILPICSLEKLLDSEIPGTKDTKEGLGEDKG